MPMLSVYVDDDTYHRMKVIEAADGVSIAQQAESSIAETVMRAAPQMQGGFLHVRHIEADAKLKSEAKKTVTPVQFRPGDHSGRDWR